MKINQIVKACKEVIGLKGIFEEPWKVVVQDIILRYSKCYISSQC